MPPNVLGATFTPHCAAIQPALLARGLADAVERRGVRLYEHTAAREIRPGPRPSVVTSGGTVRADVVVRAVEAWTPTLPGLERALVPVYSLMVATEPLGEDFWAEAGLDSRATFADHRHMIIYGQRTADGRLAFGGRGAPYHFNSAVHPSFDTEPEVHELLRHTLIELFPALDAARFTHAWGGPLGVPRDWHASVGYDRHTGLAWAGGYVGDGVATTNLAGRTLADLITGTRLGADRVAMGRAPLPAVGARAAAVARRQRRAVDHEGSRPQRSRSTGARAGWPRSWSRFSAAEPAAAGVPQSGAMKLTLDYQWRCTPGEFWACTSTRTSWSACTSRHSGRRPQKWCPRKGT